MNKIWGILGGAAVVLVAGIFLVLTLARDNNHAEITPLTHPGENGDTLVAATTAQETLSSPEKQSAHAGFIEDIQTRFGSHLERPAVQFKIAGEIIAYFRSIGGSASDYIVTEVCDEISPELSASLQDYFAKYKAYSEWEKANYYELEALEAPARSGMLWSKRSEVFGDAAYDIWDTDLQQQELHATILTLSQAAETPLEAKLFNYQGRIEEIYGEETALKLSLNNEDLIKRFLQIPSVQEELKNQDTEQRLATLQTIRELLGMEGKPLEKWLAFDRQQSEDYARGQEYLAELATIRELPESLQDYDIKKLQERLFGDQAEVIRMEEEEGHFRFEQPILFGLAK